MIKSNIHIMQQYTTPKWYPPRLCSLHLAREVSASLGRPHLTRIDGPSRLTTPENTPPRSTSFHLTHVVSAVRHSAPPIPSLIPQLSERDGHMSIATRATTVRPVQQERRSPQEETFAHSSNDICSQMSTTRSSVTVYIHLAQR